MAFTRAFLKSIGLNEDQITAVIEAHTDVTNALKGYKDKAELYDKAVKDLEDANKKITDAEGWQKKYEDEHTAFEGYKAEQTKAEEARTKKSLYEAILKAENIDEKRIPAIMKVTDFASMEMTKDGKFKDEKGLRESIKNDYSGFIVTKRTEGGGTETPLKGDEKNDFGENADYIQNFVKSRREGMYGKAKEE